MATVTNPPVQNSRLLGESNGLLTFRVRGSEHDGRVLRIQSPKCVIGSHSNCTLRLRALGVRPYHCLILHGAEGAFVRCWSSSTSLNGRGFRESRLNTGDLLDVGPIQLEVLESTPVCGHDRPIAPLEQEPPASDSVPDAGPADEPAAEAPSAEGSNRAADQTSDVSAVDQDPEEPAHQAGEHGCEDCRKAREEFETVLAARVLEVNQRYDELSQRFEKLSGELNDSQAVGTQLEERARARDQADREQQEANQTLVEEVRGELSRVRQQYEEQSSERERLAAQISTGEQEIQSLQDELNAARADLEQSRCERDEVGDVSLGKAEQQADQLRAAQSELEGREEFWKQKLGDWESAERQLQDQQQQSRDELEKTRLALTDAESTERQLQDQLKQAQDELAESRVQLTELEAKVREQSEQLAALEKRDGQSQHGRSEEAGDVAQWKDAAENLRGELQQTREEHQRARDEWHIDRENLERELAERSASLDELDAKNHQDMQEAENLIHSLQQEGKQLLMQLEEARQTVRQDHEKRKRVEEAEKITARNFTKAVPPAQTPPVQTVPVPVVPVAAVPEPVATGDTPTPVPENQTVLMKTSDLANLVHSDDAPDNVADSISEVVHTVVLDADALQSEALKTCPDQAAAAEPLPAPSAPDLEQPPAAESAGAASAVDENSESTDDDGIIQRYMERLLKRVGGSESDPVDGSQEGATAHGNAPATTALSVDRAARGADAAVSENTGETTPNAAAGETSPAKASESRNAPASMAADLLAMRELANNSAREAICNSDQRRYMAAAFGELAVASVCLISSGLVMAMSGDLLSAQAIGGSVGFAFGLVWFLRGSKTLFNALRTRHVPTLQEPTSPDK